MSPDRRSVPHPAIGAVVLLGALVLAGLGFLVTLRAVFLPDPPAERPPLELRIHGLPGRVASRLALPLEEWSLRVAVDRAGPTVETQSLRVDLRQSGPRSGSTGAAAVIPAESIVSDPGGFEVRIRPRALGLRPGPLTIHASVRTTTGRGLADEIEVTLRDWRDGPPIGRDQILHFDFEVDRDGDGEADLPKDLESFGLACPERPDLARRVADSIIRGALARVERAFEGPRSADREETSERIAIELRLESAPGDSVTRICVGGADPSGGTTIGNVRFDRNNVVRNSIECGSLPPTGLFPRELTFYREEALYRQSFDPLIADRGGIPIGGDTLDAWILSDDFDLSRAPDAARARHAIVENAIRVFADVLGTIMAHEAAHALGLVAPGEPGEGLFGGREGAGYAHNLPAEATREEPRGAGPWLMDPAGRHSFSDLAGRGEVGELVFHPLGRAYLRDQLVLRSDAARDHAAGAEPVP